ncbi:tyrosinase family oxidase copper chaperone [Streptomyces griseosporeus]|uniref:tyrosinase family oxidase copper chaperone n=1 Tax=Streptomyces griseosporeus TaxID=1910 RepID=UPI00167EEF3B|nr:tyrosinase family oxidase copper chaperone [Streptomyces griseosporeus]GHF68135.1 tyrosinase [Streptomyces griseosporeus]
MVTGVGDVAMGGAQTEAGPARPAPGGGTRREMLRGLIAPALALALTPVVVASRSTDTGAADDGGSGGGAFDETYHGRRIQGTPVPGARAYDPEQWQVTVDGRPLHLMRRADGTWLSVVDHYGSYATPLEAARAAVDALGPGEQLREREMAHGGHGGHGGHHHTGGDHGVHA